MGVRGEEKGEGGKRERMLERRGGIEKDIKRERATEREREKGREREIEREREREESG